MTPKVTPLWTPKDASEAANGITRGSWKATGVSIDSRTARPGDLFVALQGPNFDGHDYAEKAFENGCAAAMVTKTIAGYEKQCLLVNDTMAGLQGLGLAARDRAEATIFGITGSVGKTGTKEALRACLDRLGPVHATQGNLNNHIGVPLTLARMPSHVEAAVIEMGMNHPGEIAPLSEMAGPDVAMITSVTNAHIEFFADESGIADEKADIFAGLQGLCTAVLPKDNRWYDRLHRKAEDLGADSILSFGQADDADVRLTDVKAVPDGSEVTIDMAGTPLTFALGLPGRHWAVNATGIIACLMAADRNVAEAIDVFADMVPSPGRGERTVLEKGDGKALLIDESYNASPAAVQALIEVLGEINGRYTQRRILVLGDMLELGDEGPALHADLAKSVEAFDIDKVFTAGPLSRALFEALPPAKRGIACDDAEALCDLVADDVGAGDVVAVKGSLGSGTKVVVDAIKASAGAEVRHAC